MPPQPLYKVNPNARITFALSTFTRHPELAAKVMRVISIWASADAMLGQIVARFLKSDFEVVMTMMQALSGSESRRAVMLAGAKQALPKEHYNLVRAVLSATSASRNRRNNYAHHIWGFSPDIPNALLLIAPEMYNQPLINILADVRDANAGDITIKRSQEPDRTRIYVYRDKDINEDVESAFTALRLVLDLYVGLGTHQIGVGDPTLQELSSQPPIQQLLAKYTREESP